MGITDPKGLQVRASACSKQARQRALLAGQNDEKEALEILSESSVAGHSSWNSSTSSVDSKDVVRRRVNAGRYSLILAVKLPFNLG
jgi:hypothetical protein